MLEIKSDALCATTVFFLGQPTKEFTTKKRRTANTAPIVAVVWIRTVNDMKRSEAYHILRDMYDEATEEQRAAINIAMDDIEFVDLMPDDMVAAVRCKDCKHYWKNVNTPGYSGKCVTVSDDFFCAYGERGDG